MDAVKFIEERNRMCKSFVPDCEGCRVDEAKPVVDECFRWILDNPERAVQIVEQWSAAHPRKTRQSEFLEQFPKAKLDNCNVVSICPKMIYGDSVCLKLMSDGSSTTLCADCRLEFWSKEVE